jgi:catechol 2,3-dioxygenase-like lactoylglutathione lyase family enzyme
MSAPTLVTGGSVVLDCPDPEALAAFYARLLGWAPAELSYEGAWATLRNPAGGLAVEFQRAADYRPPTWPEPRRPQMFHLDLTVPDLDAASAHALVCGAVPLDLSEDHPTFRVYADPAGHPFCLCAC